MTYDGTVDSGVGPAGSSKHQDEGSCLFWAARLKNLKQFSAPPGATWCAVFRGPTKRAAPKRVQPPLSTVPRASAMGLNGPVRGETPAHVTPRGEPCRVCASYCARRWGHRWDNPGIDESYPHGGLGSEAMDLRLERERLQLTPGSPVPENQIRRAASHPWGTYA